MKRRILFAFVLSVSLAQADDLVELRESYEKRLEEVAKPIREDYLKRLRALKEELTKRGELEQAVAVNDEIRRIEFAAAIALTPELLVSREWKHSVPTRRWEALWTFTADGHQKSNRGQVGKWSIRGERLRHDALDGAWWVEFALDLERRDGQIVLREVDSSDGKRADAVLVADE